MKKSKKFAPFFPNTIFTILYNKSKICKLTIRPGVRPGGRTTSQLPVAPSPHDRISGQPAAAGGRAATCSLSTWESGGRVIRFMMWAGHGGVGRQGKGQEAPSSCYGPYSCTNLVHWLSSNLIKTLIFEGSILKFQVYLIFWPT